MAKTFPPNDSSDDPLQSLIADFLDAEGRGESIDRQAWLAQHESHADSLRDFLANHDRMKQAAPIAPDDVTLPPNSHTHNDITLPPDNATASSRTTAVGDRLRYFGDYELLEEIARGGMGVVYKALQINLNRIVALKMILAGQLASEQDVQRFRTEAESAANLDHPRIVPIYEVGQHAGQHYFSMGFVDGKSLAQKIVDGPMAPRDAAEMLVKICEGIAYAHERGVIHRDLKPANILLDQNEQPKVTDFGLAKKLGSDSNLTGTGQILGTPSYMAPEQASGKIDEVGPLADIYALGAILYCLLTGRPPFQAANPMDTLLQVLDKEPIPPRQLSATIPVDLETICLKCLSKEPHRRYSHANELSQELGRFLRGEPILARPVGKLEQAWRWCKRNPALAGSMATAAVLLIVGTTVSSVFAMFALDRSAAALRSELAAREEAIKANEATASAEAARVDTEAALASSLYQQARTIQALAEPGFRWRSLDALKRASPLLKNVKVNQPHVDRPDLPSIEHLRSAAISALLSRDVRLVKEWKGFIADISPDGKYALISDLPDYQKLMGTELSTEDRIRMLENSAPRIVELGLHDDNPGQPVPDLKWKPGQEIALGPAAKQIAILGESAASIQVHSLPTFKLTRKLDCNLEGELKSVRVGHLCFSPDGHYLSCSILSGNTISLLLWDLTKPDAAPRLLSTISNKNKNHIWLRPCFSADSQRLVCINEQGEPILHFLTDLRSQKFSVAQNIIGFPSFSWDGKHLIVLTTEREESSDMLIQFLNVDYGNLDRRIIAKGAVGGGMCSASPDGRWLAIGRLAGGLQIVDQKTGKSTEIDSDGMVVDATWSSDSRNIFAVSGRGIKCYEWSVDSIDSVVSVTSQSDRKEDGRRSIVRSFTFTNKAKTVFVHRCEGEEERIEQIDLSSGGKLQSVDLDSGQLFYLPSKLLVSQDDRWLALIRSSYVQIWNMESLASNDTSFFHQSNILNSMVAFRDTGPVALTFGNQGQGDATLIDLRNGEIISSMGNSSNLLCWSSSGKSIVTQTGRHSYQIAGFDEETEKAFAIPTPKTQGLSRPDIVFSPNDRWVAALFTEGFVPSRMSVPTPALLQNKNVPVEGFLLDLRERRTQRDLRYVDLDGLWFSPNGTLMATFCGNATLEVCRVDDGQVLFQIPIRSTRKSLNEGDPLLNLQRFEMAFTPDSKSIAFCDDDGVHMRLVDLELANQELTKMGLGW